MVSFLHPGFLYALFILAVPIILHFFSFKKYKKVYFSNFNFLESLQQQKKNSSKLKNLLLLLLRLITLAAIIIAFATPYIAPANAPVTDSSKEQVVVYIDNSFSMSNTGSKGSLLEEAKKHVFDIINTYPAGTAFTLLTNNSLRSKNLSREQVVDMLGGLKTTPAIKKMSDIFKEVRTIAEGKPTTFFMLSDFQKHACDFQKAEPDSLIKPIFLVLEPENKNNLYIKDVTFEQAFHRKNQTDKIAIRVVNASDKDFNNVPVNLTINDKKKSVNKVNIPANSETVVDINYLNTENGYHGGVVEISDFPVVFDNKYYFSYSTDDQINVLCIEQDNHTPYFGKLFSDSTAFSITYVNVNQTSNVNFNKYNLIILDQLNSIWTGLESALESYVQDGGNLFVLPGEQISANVMNKLLQKMHAPQYGSRDTNSIIAHLEEQSTLFKDVFEKQDGNTVYPRSKKFYRLANTDNAEKLLTDKRGNTVLAAQRLGNGNIYISAFNYNPDNSDMVYHPIFVPVMVNMAYNINAVLRTAYNLNTETAVSVNNKITDYEGKLHIRNLDNSIEFIPDVRKDFSGNLVITNIGNITNAGLYEVLKDEEVIDLLAFNYDRDESQMSFCDEEELQKQFPQALVKNIKTTRLDHNSELVKEIVLQDNNRYLSGWFILLAVIALLLEQVVWRKKLL